ncbi:DUF4355 domain-containing protein [Clostridium estertheticum]|uniref:DUF4355 domain-containing protein n=1 Tax=Clostridium estertheticum TaxID=238834 RepID=UPI001C0B7592|nr:DUF4355 domain-containing protein [Clostridium estertheticum]MBU3176084.1 DUF4355 domain-containing protein [Clostridium estertheticum]
MVKKFSGLDAFKSKMNDADFKSFMDSEKDKHLTKGIETFKTNNLGALVDAEVLKKYPTKDPNEIALENMKTEMEKMRTESSRKDLKTNAMKILSDKKLPTDLVDYFIGADEATTTDNLTKFETMFNAGVTTLVAEKLKGGYVPPDGKAGVDPNSMGMKLALQAQESQKQAATAKNYFE